MSRRIFVISALLVVTYLGVFAQERSNDGKYPVLNVSRFMDSSNHWYTINDQDKVIHSLEGHPQYARNEITKIADNILLFQKDNGGWAKNYDMLAIMSDKQIDSIRSVKQVLNTTFDNGTTYSQISYLAEVYSITKEEKYKTAFLKGLDFLFASQYKNGGWPQFYPQMKDYARYITFNDGAMIGVMLILKSIIDNKPEYSFVDELMRTKVKVSFNEGIECILKCQIKENGKLYAWCQQHDEKNFKPRWARTFEPPCICNGESCGIVELLMSIKNPNKEIIGSIQSAVKWFEESKIYNTRVETVQAPQTKFIYQTNSIDCVVIHDTNAVPIWTRFYELKTHKPLFCDRGYKMYYSLDRVSRERRSGYKYYIDDPQKILNMYPDWQKQWAPDQNILAK
jgi:PelA/Pel-15E family pectate lyase